MRLTTLIIALFLVLHSSNYSQAKNTKTQKETASKPNVIFFALDDLNDWVNPLGYSQAITPNMDRLAAAGVTFTNAHAPGTFCAPSRTAIFTGLQSSTTGCYNAEVYHYDYPELVPLQMAFKEAGYNTYGVGKLFHHGKGHIDLRAWDEYYTRNKAHREGGYNMGYDDDLPFPDPKPNSPYYTKTGKKWIGGGFLEWAGFPDEMEEEMLEVKRTRWACDVLKYDHEKPFFLALGLYTPHFPNYAPQKYFDMYKRSEIVLPEIKADDWDDLPLKVKKRMMGRYNVHQKTLEDIDAVEDAVLAYLACVSYADGMLGLLLDALDASKYKDNTIVVLWSDQGYHHGEKGQWGKHTPWKETSHIPLIFAGANLPKSEKVNSTVGLIDLYPTLIELCNLPTQHKMDGVSLASAIKKTETAQDRDLFIPYHKRGGYTVVNSNHRYIYYNDGGEEFYNLREDPNEWNNLAGEEKSRTIINQMKKVVPSEFSPAATSTKDLKLIIEGDSFRWEHKKGGKPIGKEKISR